MAPSLPDFTQVVIKLGFENARGIKLMRSTDIGRSMFRLRARCNGCKRYWSVEFYPRPEMNKAPTDPNQWGVNSHLTFVCPINCRFEGRAAITIDNISDATFDKLDGDFTNSYTREIKRKEVLRLSIRSIHMNFATEQPQCNGGLVDSSWIITLLDGTEVTHNIPQIAPIHGDNWYIAGPTLYPSLL